MESKKKFELVSVGGAACSLGCGNVLSFPIACTEPFFLYRIIGSATPTNSLRAAFGVNR
jgi:hypothetical protein